MIHLIASIVCSIVVAVLLKIVRKQKIDIHQAVAMNYIAVVTLTILMLKLDLGSLRAFLPTWWLFAVLGVLLPSMPIIMDKPVDVVSIVRSDAAQQLSLFLSIVTSFVLFDEKLTGGRLIGITLAFIALFCLLWKSSGGKKPDRLMNNTALLLDVWSDYGVIGILFKQVAKSGTALSGNLLVAFSLVTVLMFGYLPYRPTKWTKEGVIGGAVLGYLNFINVLTYIRTHQVMSENPTSIFADMSVGVIVPGTLVGTAAFKEKISGINAAGISVAVCSVACLFYWPRLRLLVRLQGPAAQATLR